MKYYNINKKNNNDGNLTIFFSQYEHFNKRIENYEYNATKALYEKDIVLESQW